MGFGQVVSNVVSIVYDAVDDLTAIEDVNSCKDESDAQNENENGENYLDYDDELGKDSESSR